jgi:hypothetical protein
VRNSGIIENLQICFRTPGTVFHEKISMTSKMHFALWFNGVALPVMFLWMGNLPIALCLTVVLFGLMSGVKWLFIKALRAESQGLRLAARSRAGRAPPVPY